MKKLLFTLLILVGFAMQATAQSFQSGDLLYSVIGSNPPRVSLDGHVDGTAAQGPLLIPDTVEYHGNSYAVTEISPQAFCDCRHLSGDLVIPNTVKRIGKRAFCQTLMSTLTLPNSVIEIGREAFRSTRFSGSLVLPNALERLEPGVFKESPVFTGDLVIPESVTYIGDSAFAWCYGFDGQLKIEGLVQSIGKSAFHGCSSLKGDLLIPESVQDLGRGAFYKCSGFNGMLSLPTQLTTIHERCFDECSGFTGSLVIPESVTTIEDYAFIRCGFSGELFIPNNVVSVGLGAFAECNGITSLVLGGNVERMEYLAFSNLTNLQSMKIHVETPPELHYLTFANVPRDIPVYIPCNTLELYQNADYWGEFTNFIEDCSLVVDENGLNGVMVSTFPNPAKGNLNLEFSPDVTPTRIELYDLQGRLVRRQTTALECINMEGLAAGTYMMRVTLEGGKVFSDKVVKE